MVSLRKSYPGVAFTLLMCLIALTGNGQTDRPYHINGSAYQETCNCYTLTPDQFFTSGSVWNINKINLNEPFDFKFTIFLGCEDADGADGIAFVLQPISTSIGTVGGGMGYEGVSPSIAVLVDTWQNFEDNDPWQDHISIHKNGIIDHGVMTDVTAPVPASAYSGNIEDCQWHVLRIRWDPSTYTLSVDFDGVFRTAATYNIVKEVFHDDPMVFWGFTSATGGSKNHQRMCTSLDPKFIFPEDQLTCFPQTIHFIDSSISFGSIEKWMWDFGDGTKWEASSSPPPHDYPAPGEYEATLRIIGNDGCLSEPFVKTIVIGTEPVPGFTYSPYPVCDGSPTTLDDTSFVQFGTINKWKWKIGNETVDEEEPPPVNISGTMDISLQVSTLEGCESEETVQSLTSHPTPAIDFDSRNICVSEPSLFQARQPNSPVAVSRWLWNLGDGSLKNSFTPSLNYQYKRGGEYEVKLTGYSQAGCASQEIVKTVKVYETNAFAGNDTIIAVNQPLQLLASGGEMYRWTPAEGLSADNIANPVATLSKSTSFLLTAYTEAGCATTDTLNIKVYKGPAFYVPSAFSPNADGENDDFRFIAVGMQRIDLFQVYNRYGQLVYSSTQVMKGWDGRVSGKDQPAGTYVWVISGIDFNGIKHSQKGTVTLVR